MSLKAALELFYRQNKSTLTKMRYDLGRELVVLVSSSTLLGLFFYIFQDFLNEKIVGIPGPLQTRLIHGFLVFLLLVIGPVVGSHIQKLLYSDCGWRQLAHRCGENPKTLRTFLIIQTSFLLILFYGSYWYWVVAAFARSDSHALIPWQLVSLGLALGRIFIGQAARHGSTLKPILSDKPSSRRHTLVVWRWYQLSRRHQLAKLCMLLIGLLLALNGLLLWWRWPLFLVIFVSLLASILLSAAVAFQLEEDMRSIWFERQMGCSHEEYVAVYQQLCLALGGALAVTLAILLFAIQPESFLKETWKALPIAALCPVLLPAVMFQLAPDRSLLQILVVALLGLFIGTAIYAHSLGLLLVPLVVYYAKQYQKDNFYRS